MGAKQSEPRQDVAMEEEARRSCDFLFKSVQESGLPAKMAESLILIAFTVGAAWALDEHGMVEMARAQFESIAASARNGLD